MAKFFDLTPIPHAMHFIRIRECIVRLNVGASVEEGPLTKRNVAKQTGKLNKKKEEKKYIKKKKAKEFVIESRRKMIQEIGAPAKSDANGQAEEAKCRRIYGSIR